MKEFVYMLKNEYKLSWEAIDLLTNRPEILLKPKGHILIEEGVVEKYVYILVKGLARGYFYKDGKDITIWFAHPGMCLLSMNSYMFSKPGYENVQLMEKCELLPIDRVEFQMILNTNTELANWARKLSDEIILRMEHNQMERSFKSASERYNSFIQREPEISKKVPLKHIASYLGISQVSLSRIRSGIQ